MKKTLLILALIFNLVAQENESIKNPVVFSSIGDKIYNNVNKINNLKTIDHYAAFQLKIDEYSYNVKSAKKLGFSVESGEKSEQKLSYLKTIRKLEKVNDYYYNLTNKDFNVAIQTQNSKLYIDLVNSEMIDIDVNRYRILDYYTTHLNDINSSGIIDILLKEEEIKRNNRYVGKTKKQLQEEKMKRVRAADARKQKALEEKLAKELSDKKIEIRQEQQKELFKH